MAPRSLWQRLQGKPSSPRRPRPVSQPAARVSEEIWMVDEGRRVSKLASIDWDADPGKPIDYTPPQVVLPPRLVDEARMAVLRYAGVVIPVAELMPLLTGSLAAGLQQHGGLDTRLRMDLLDAVGRRLVQQGWPGPGEQERLRPYLMGVQVAARRQGWDVEPLS